jgi:steroid 5-alpha reductase family enzyme
MFGIYQLQAFWCATFSSLPLMAIINVKPFQFYDIIGLGLFILAFTGEAIADHQLKIFKDRDSYRTEVCQRGLWAWSRHPNYFFEWLHWWSYVLFLIGTIYILPGILITLFMYYLINKVTGIPPTEERMLESRPQAYMEYQKITSPFFPLPPKF